MMDECAAQGARIVVAAESGQQAGAVFAGLGRQGDAEDIGASREQVYLADGLRARAAGLDDGWPAHHKRDAMTALVDIAFTAAEFTVAGVLVLLRTFRVSGFPAIIAALKNEGITGQAVPIEGGEDLTDAVVGLDGVKKVREAIGDFPLVAIGGINFENFQSVLDAGANSAAIVSGIISEPEKIAENFRRFNGA